jgi:hypothetical protein
MYLGMHNPADQVYIDTSISPSMEVRDIIAGKACEVCGVGALFVAKLDRVDALTIGDMELSLNNDSAMRRYLETEFSAEQLALIEIAFEGQWIIEQLVETEQVQLDEMYEPCGDECCDDVGSCKACPNCELRPAPRAAHRFYRALDHYMQPEQRLRDIMLNIIANGGDFIP